MRQLEAQSDARRRRADSDPGRSPRRVTRLVLLIPEGSESAWIRLPVLFSESRSGVLGTVPWAVYPPLSDMGHAAITSHLGDSDAATV